MTTFAETQALGNIAYDLAIALGAGPYDAAVAYQEAVTPTGSTWTCPCCGKVECAVDTLCYCCEGDEDDRRDDAREQDALRHGR